MENVRRKNKMIETYSLLLIDMISVLAAYWLALVLRFDIIKEAYPKDYHATVGCYILILCLLYALFMDGNRYFFSRNNWRELFCTARYTGIIMIGLVLGIALVWFVVVPAKENLTRSEADAEIKQYSEQVAAKASVIEELETNLSDLESKNKNLQKQIEGYEGENGVLTAYDSLLQASALYLDGKSTQAAEAISGISEQTAKEAKEGFQTMYAKINSEVMGKAAQEYYDTGYAAYSSGRYDEAVENLQKAYAIDNTSVMALYYTARSYQKMGDEKFPGTKSAKDAEANLPFVTTITQ